MDTTFKANAQAGSRATESPRVESFDARLTAIDARLRAMLGDAFLGLLLSIGHRTALFDAMAELPPTTSGAIAKAAGLDVRYVQEWLSAMATRNIVEYDPIREHFHLPKAHAARLTRRAGAENLAFLAQYVALAAEHESRLVDCFRKGTGISADEYPDLARLRADASHLFLETHLLTSILPLVPWLGAKLERGITVADVSCRRGHALELLAEAFPNSRFIGFDPSEESLAIARERIERRGFENVELFAHDPKEPLPGRFDFLMSFDVVHELAAPGLTLAHVHEALRPESPFLMVDVAASSRLATNLENPLAPLLYGFSTLCSIPISRAEDGEALGAAWGEEHAEGLLEEAGFREVEVHHLPADPMHVVFVGWKR